MTVAHKVVRRLQEIAYYPAHPPRKETPRYRATHHKLVYELDTPCWVCGIRNSTGGRMETHHSVVEWAFKNAIDEDKVKKYLKQKNWDLDGEGNMLVLCAKHHRGRLRGIHSITYPVWVIQKFARRGWDIVTGPTNPPN